MTIQEAEELIRRYQVEHYKEMARESKLRADLVEKQVEVYEMAVKRMKENHVDSANVGLFKNPFQS